MSKVTEIGLEVAHRSADLSLPSPTATENATEQADSKLRKILKSITLEQCINFFHFVSFFTADISLCCATVHNSPLQLPEVGEIEQYGEFIHIFII